MPSWIRTHDHANSEGNAIPRTLQDMIGKQEAQRAEYRAPEYNVPPF